MEGIGHSGDGACLGYVSEMLRARRPVCSLLISVSEQPAHFPTCCFASAQIKARSTSPQHRCVSVVQEVSRLLF